MNYTANSSSEEALRHELNRWGSVLANESLSHRQKAAAIAHSICSDWHDEWAQAHPAYDWITVLAAQLELPEEMVHGRSEMWDTLVSTLAVLESHVGVQR